MRANNSHYLGKQVGSYHIVDYLGSGGFADVYLGEHKYLKTAGAIKMLHIRLSKYALHNFLNEAKIIARLEHPNIIRILDYGVQDGNPFLVMNYAQHGTLRQRYPHGTHLTLKQIVPFIKQAASALDYAHQQKLIHRDVKPANMLLGQQQQLLLSDFGLALATSGSDSQPDSSMLDSSAGSPPKINTAGTIAYMAPEQIQGKACYASDQYSLAIIAYEWICGEYPFTGSFLEIASQHMLTLPPSLNMWVPNLPSEVERIIFKALAKDPKQRFAHVSDFAQALEEACQAVEHTNIFTHKNTITSFAREGVTSQIRFDRNGTSPDFYIHKHSIKLTASSESARDLSDSSDSDTTYSTLKIPTQADNASSPPLPTDITHKIFKSSRTPHKTDTTLPDPEQRRKRKLYFTLLSAAMIALLISAISLGAVWYGTMHATPEKGLLQRQPHLLSKNTPQVHHTLTNLPKNTPAGTTPISITQGGTTTSTLATPGSTTNLQPISSPSGQLSQSISTVTPDCIQGSSSNITFTASFHGGDPAPAPFYLKNCGGNGSKIWQLSIQSSGWLTLSPTSGSIDPGASSEIQIQVTNDKLKSNTYSGSILFTAGTSSWILTITYIVVKS